MPRKFDGAQYWVRSSALVTAAPWTFTAWFFPYNVSQSSVIVGVGINEAVATNLFELRQVTTNTRALSIGSATGFSTGTANNVVANRWNFAAAVSASSSNRQTFANNVAATADSTTVTVSGLNQTMIGARALSGGGASGSFYNGVIGECAIWNVALSVGELQGLWNGISPFLIQPAALVAFWPMRGQTSQEFDYLGHYPLTNTGASMPAPLDLANPRRQLSPLRARRKSGAVAAVTYSDIIGDGSVVGNLGIIGDGAGW